MISCVVLTLNEEDDLPGCLESLAWCDDIHILDSGSTDTTLQIASHFGATINVNVQQGLFKHAVQRNFALDNLTFAHKWILFIDADERTPPSFVDAVQHAVTHSKQYNSFFCAPKFIYQGKWLKNTKSFPTWEPRLLLHGKVAFDPGTWERFTASSITGRIIEPYDHYPDSKGFDQWLRKHALYALWEAEESPTASTARRIASKFGSMRPFLVTAWFIFIRRAYLDGRAGISYSRRMLIYELMISEARRQQNLKWHSEK